MQPTHLSGGDRAPPGPSSTPRAEAGARALPGAFGPRPRPLRDDDPVRHDPLDPSGLPRERVLPKLAIVIVTLPQVREEAYLSAFDAAWHRNPIEPVAGAIIEWP